MIKKAKSFVKVSILKEFPIFPSYRNDNSLITSSGDWGLLNYNRVAHRTYSIPGRFTDVS